MNVLASRGQLRASFFRWALLTVPAVMLLGFLAGTVVQTGPENPWFNTLAKPATYPPPAAFGIVWTILYAMMGFALALVCAAWGARGRGIAIAFFLLQLLVNLAWTPVFFGMQDMQAALIVIAVLDLLALITTVLFWRVRRLAAVLMLPYLGWILFATLLNWQFIALNPDASANSSGALQRVEL